MKSALHKTHSSVITFTSLALLTLAPLTLTYAQETPVQNEYVSKDESLLPFRGWKQADTEHFTFRYENASEEFAKAYASIADDAWNKVGKAYGWPQEHTDVLVTGRTNLANALTLTGDGSIIMYTTQFLTPEFCFREYWPRLIFTHELTHAAHTLFEGKSFTPSKIFGPVWHSLSFSFGNPDWLTEGLATVMETELTNGGRGRSPYFELDYKSLTMENAFLSFSEIGTESRPPRGQSYVAGYLIMRGIADRWGLGALADIERNRTGSTSWEESIKKVTGHTPEEIYLDTTRALAKRYADENKISTGHTITPHKENTYYQIPSRVFADGSFITLRTKDNETLAVKITPGAPEPEEKELFPLFFTDTLALTASSDGLCVASAFEFRFDKAPGMIVNANLYTWKESGKPKLLTKGAAIFQPTLSADGKTLVAVEAAGIQTRLVKVDVETGKRSVLADEENVSFMQPSVNEDGTKLAFIRADGTRGSLCVMDLSDGTAEYTQVANAEGFIEDIAYPRWNSDGSLTYSSNKRGRLEEWVIENGTSVPALADPVGVQWAFCTENGIYYSTASSLGKIIKIKPLSEWKNVPDFTGPSLPGEIITVGKWADDFPDFTPFTPKEKTEVLTRGETFLQKSLSEPEEPKTKLTGERPWVPLPKFQAWLPLLDFISLNGTDYMGLGGAAFWGGPLLQYPGSMIPFMGAVALYYPEIGQADFSWVLEYPLGTSLLFLDFTHAPYATENVFTEKYNILISFSIPFFDYTDGFAETDISFVTGLRYSAQRSADTAFTMAENSISWNHSISGTAGVEAAFSYKTTVPKIFTNSWYFGADALALTLPGSSLYGGRIFPGAQGEIMYTGMDERLGMRLSARGRWCDYPSAQTVDFSRGDNLERFSKNKNMDCTYPGRIVFHGGILASSILLPGITWQFFMEQLVSFGTNSIDYATPQSNLPLNMTLSGYTTYGLSFIESFGRTQLEMGFVFDAVYSDIESSDFACFITYRLDAIR